MRRNLQFVTAVLILILGLSTLVLINKKTPTDQAQQQVTDPYKDWLTYTSKVEPGLSFKYPADWSFTNLTGTQAGAEAVDFTGPSGIRTQVIFTSAVLENFVITCTPGSVRRTLTSVITLPKATGLYQIHAESEKDNVALDGILGEALLGGVPKAGGCVQDTGFGSRADPKRIYSLKTLQSPIESSDRKTVDLIFQSLSY